MLSCITFLYASCIIFLAVLKFLICTIMESWIGKISMLCSTLVSIICSIINASRFINVLQTPVQKASLIFLCFTFRAFNIGLIVTSDQFGSALWMSSSVRIQFLIAFSAIVSFSAFKAISVICFASLRLSSFVRL